MAKAKMGDVIKDFYKSDAPQFAGRSKSKRRQMAIAAKLGAMRKSRMSEELKGNQHKIDANKNNKIDAQDFKLLRSKMKMKKEEVEQVGEAFVLHKGKSAPGSTSTISGTHHGVTVKPVYTDKKEAQAHADKINAGRGYKPGDEKSSLYRGVLYQVSPARQMKKEEVEQVDEVIGNTTGYSDSGPRNKADERKFHQMRNVVTKGPRKGKITKFVQNRLKDRLMSKTHMDEEIEQVNELEKSTLGSYLKKASKEYGRDKQIVGRESPDGTVAKARPEVRQKLKVRMRGIERAADRLAK
jgi:hypothetical protein